MQKNMKDPDIPIYLFYLGGGIYSPSAPVVKLTINGHFEGMDLSKKK